MNVKYLGIVVGIALAAMLFVGAGAALDTVNAAYNAANDDSKNFNHMLYQPDSVIVDYKNNEVIIDSSKVKNGLIRQDYQIQVFLKRFAESNPLARMFSLFVTNHKYGLKSLGTVGDFLKGVKVPGIIFD